MFVFENMSKNISNPSSPLRVFWNHKYPSEQVLSLKALVSLFAMVL